MSKFIITDIYFLSILYSIFILAVLYYKGLDKLENRLLFISIIFVSIILILEALTWILDGEPHLRTLNIIANSLLMSFNPLPAVAMISFFNLKMRMDVNALKKDIKFYLIPFLIAVVLIILNLFNGWVFTIDEQNIYARNMGIYCIPVLSIILYPIEFIRLGKHLIGRDGRILLLMLIFFFSPIVGSIFQLLFYGVGLIWPLMIFSIVMAVFIFEYHDTKKDRLTRLENREVVENRIGEMIRRKIPFSLIMIDLDNFKIVNDRYGHLEGDRVLKYFSEILLKSVRKEDIVSRFAGDEFLIIVESELKDSGKNLIERINVSLDELNTSNILPTNIAFSSGVLYCDNLEGKTSKELISQVDKYMYIQKKKHASI